MAKMSPERVNNFLMSILTTVSIAVLGFLWNVNNTIVALKEKDVNRESRLTVIEGKIDKLDQNQQDDKINNARTASKVDDIQYMLTNKKYSK